MQGNPSPSEPVAAVPLLDVSAARRQQYKLASMLDLDGSQGEGGGQILRSSLALSMVTGTPVRIRNVRARRPKPGLMRQHLVAVQAAARIGGARVTGTEIGSSTLTFIPGTVKPGEHELSVGSAGSTTLVLQTVLPALLCASEPSLLILEGGTHNPMAPPFEFLERTYLPLVNRMGPRVHAELERAGSYPAGGGRDRGLRGVRREGRARRKGGGPSCAGDAGLPRRGSAGGGAPGGPAPAAAGPRRLRCLATLPLSGHALTQIDLIPRFLEVGIRVEGSVVRVD